MHRGNERSDRCTEPVPSLSRLFTPIKNQQWLFYPRPPFRAGATVASYMIAQRTIVSILARPFERALRRTPRRRSRRCCFNPRPPFRAGATVGHRVTGHRERVSILARPFERALPYVGIAMETAKRFQSSPALSSGRYCNTVAEVDACTGFNPRPPFRAGATALPHQGQKTWGLALVFANLLQTH